MVVVYVWGRREAVQIMGVADMDSIISMLKMFKNIKK